MTKFLKNQQSYVYVSLLTSVIFFVFLSIYIDINSYRSKLAYSTSENLYRGINQNEDLLRYTGEVIVRFGEENLKNIEKIIKPTTGLSHKSLATSYISWADKEGHVLISGKAGIVKKGEKTIRHRSYFTSAKKDPWFLKISEPERSVFSSKYVLPTSLGLSDNSGKFLGYLILGLKLDELYEYIVPRKTEIGYEVYIFDTKSQKYIPRFNSDDETYIKTPGNNFYKHTIKGTQLEVHVYRDISLILWSWLYKNKLLIFSILTLLGVVCFQLCNVDVVKKRLCQLINYKKMKSFDQVIKGLECEMTHLITNNTLLSKSLVRKDKSKEIIGHTLLERETHQKEVFNRLRGNLSDLGVMIRTIKEVSKSEKLSWLVTKCQIFIDDFEHIGLLESARQSFSLNSVISESLLYYASDFEEEKIKVYKNFSKEMPICTGDPLTLKQVIIIILGKILDEGYGLGKVEIKTDYNESSSLCFKVEIHEKSSQDKLLYQFVTESVKELILKLGYKIEVESYNKNRHWILSFNDRAYSKDDHSNKLASVHPLKGSNRLR